MGMGVYPPPPLYMSDRTLGIHCSPISSIALLVDSITRFSLLSEDAKIFRSSMYRRSVTFALFGLDSLLPSLALIFHAMGFRQTVKNLGERASPWGRPLRNLIYSDVSRPCFVVATTPVFQLLLNFSIVLNNQIGNLCRILIYSNQPWSTES